DLELLNTSTIERWQPWVLSSYPEADSLNKPAEREKDSLNNVEQITLDNPAAGEYQLRISGFNVSASQEFFLSYQFDSADTFEWQFPTAIDYVNSAQSNAIRWGPISGSGLLEYSIDRGTSWQEIKSNVDLSVGFLHWTVPDFIQRALLRMSVGANRYVSDTFTVSARTLTGIGFNCPDSVLFYWRKLPGVKDYRVFALGDQYLEPITVLSDSQIILPKKSFPSIHYAVAPLISGKEGIKSFTIDYSSQGVSCYFRSFLGMFEDGAARLNLNMGTLYGITAIVLEKQIDGKFVLLEKLQNPTQLQLSFFENKIDKGLNIYRIKLELANGSVIYSAPEIVYNLSASSFIIYPNPVQQFHPLQILTSNDIITEVNLQVYDIYGRKVFQHKLNNFKEEINTSQLSKGLYIFRFMVKDSHETIMKVVVQ
ncbi:MAG: T9SS type A sorting domain-containing protein, partial [Chitinophagaceae bacterium]